MRVAWWVQPALIGGMGLVFVLWLTWGNLKQRIRYLEKDVDLLRKDLEHQREQQRKLWTALYRTPLSR